MPGLDVLELNVPGLDVPAAAAPPRPAGRSGSNASVRSACASSRSASLAALALASSSACRAVASRLSLACKAAWRKARVCSLASSRCNAGKVSVTRVVRRATTGSGDNSRCDADNAARRNSINPTRALSSAFKRAAGLLTAVLTARSIAGRWARKTRSSGKPAALAACTSACNARSKLAESSAGGAVPCSSARRWAPMVRPSR